jgi:hypothetical protein
MLHKATLIDGDNVIYKMAFLGSIEQANRKEYDKVRLEAAPVVLKTFNGIGFLNKYFREVLYRIKET